MQKSTASALGSIFAGALVALGPLWTVSASAVLAAAVSPRVSHVVARTGNVDFTGNWVVVDLAKPLETAILEVSNEDAATGTFSGTIIPPSDATGAFVDPFTCHDARVSGDRFSFTLDRTGIGGTGPDDRNATYTASWTGTITGGTASGSIDAKLQPGTLLNPDGFAGMRNFSAHRQSSVSASPATGPVAGGNEVRLTGTGLDGAVTAQVSDMDGNLLATAPVSGDSNTGFSFKAPNLTKALDDADNAHFGTSALHLQVVPIDAQGLLLAAPADYAVSAPIVSSLSPVKGSVGGGQDVDVRGSYFDGASAVDFQSPSIGTTTSPVIVSAPVTVNSDASLQFKTPNFAELFKNSPSAAGSSGPPAQITVDMYVRVNVANSLSSVIYSNSKPFTIDNLQISAVTPKEGPLIGGDNVDLTGVGFTNVSEVNLVAANAAAGKAPASIPIAVHPTNDTSISFTVPNDTTYAAGTPGVTTFDIVLVATVSGTRETSATSSSDRYTYDGPTVTSVSAGGVPLSALGGFPLTIHGQDFQGVTKVLFEATNFSPVEVAPSSVSANSIDVTTPDVTSDLKTMGQKSGQFHIVVEIPVQGSTHDYLPSIWGVQSTVTFRN